MSANLERRRGELPAAETVIGEEVEKYWQWVAGLAAVPVLTRDARARWTRCASASLPQALRRLGDLTPEQRAAVEELSQSLMNKFLHEPTVRLRAAAANGRGLGVVDAARYLFALDVKRAGDRRAADAERDRRERRPLMPAVLITGGAGSSARTSASGFSPRAGPSTSSTTSSTGKRENVPAAATLARSSTSATRAAAELVAQLQVRRDRAPRRADGRAAERRGSGVRRAHQHARHR